VAWDASRQVPWAKLIKPFALYFVVANAVMLAIAPGKYGPGTFIGTVFGGVFYLLIGIVAVKFGWQPMSYAQRREQAAERAQARRATSSTGAKGGGTANSGITGTRARPAPTRRTASGVGRQKR
jgi:hypothetical protein